MSLHIDPKELTAFSTLAAGHSADLAKVQVAIDLHPEILGKFAEATDLVAALNLHTAQVNQRLQATSDALLGLSKAAATVATLSQASDADIAEQMKKINHDIDVASRGLGRLDT